MNYNNKKFLILLVLTFNCLAMNQGKKLLQQHDANHAEKERKNLLLRYRMALLSFELPTKEKPLQEMQFYALAHPNDKKSSTIETFISRYLNDFANTAYSLRDANTASPSQIGPETRKAADVLLDNEESLQQLVEMHQYVKKQIAKERG